MRLKKPWKPLTQQNIGGIRSNLGVYEIQDRWGDLVFIGYAGGKSIFGLHGELQRELATRGEGYSFRCEVNMQYMSRYKELLMIYVADHGQLPRDNRQSPPRLGHLHPA